MLLHSVNNCSDFRNESNGIFTLCWFFFLRQIATFQLPIFDGIFLYESNDIVTLSLNLKRYFTCGHFSYSYGSLIFAILASLGQLTRDIVRAINAQAEIQCLLEIVPNWLENAYLP